MRSSARSAVLRRILRCAREGTPQLHRAAPPAQRELAMADHTELAICDQTIDEHRIGLTPLLRRVWAPIGQRPIAPVRHRFEWRYLVGFVHPASGRTLFHLATTVCIPVFEVELAEFARQAGASPSKQIVLVLDRAGWHTSVQLRIPDHVHVLFLPPYSPELQPAEHLWPLTNAALVN